MKYKLIGIALCFFSILLAIIVPSLANHTEKRYHQHFEAETKAECAHGDEIFCTHLPLIEIDTNGTDIPGRAIKDEHGKIIDHTLTDSGEDFIYAEMAVVDNEGTNNHIDDSPATESRIKIHVRGNTSRTFAKAGYALTLIDENGENNPQNVMGMDSHHEWALHGPFLDKTLIRNYMWYNISGEIMDYAPNVRFCEVIINGEYQGVYVMTETITAGDNGARLNLSVDKKDNSFSGYLLKLDRGSESDLKNINQFSNYSYRAGTLMNIEYPGNKNLTPEMNESICWDFSAFEKSLYSYDYDNSKYGYKKYIDTQSFVDYFIINEFTCNYDAGWLSTYIYKDIDGKLRMCVWDFNSACDLYRHSIIETEHFEMQTCLWFNMLIKDEDFVEEVIDRYRELRETYLSEEYLNKYIDEVIEYLGPAIDRNYEKWGYTFAPEYDMLKPNERNPRTCDEAVQDLKDFLKVRTKWLDENIESLRQYCAESKVKKFNENAN